MDRKNRDPVIEIMQLNRELTKDQTGMLLVQQKVLSDLKNTHCSEIVRIKEDHRRMTDGRMHISSVVWIRAIVFCLTFLKI